MLVEIFIQYIPNKLVSTTTSRLHPYIRAIIDCTLTKTTKPSYDQELLYNGHYKMHGRITQFLVDYDGQIIAFWTNIHGKIHDSLIAMYNKEFQNILNGYYCIGDSGFQSVSWVVGGFKPCIVAKSGPEVKVFDKIARNEQRIIEIVHGFFKMCKSVDKQTTFIHCESHYLACIIIAAGLYNLKRSWGYFCSSSFNI